LDLFKLGRVRAILWISHDPPPTQFFGRLNLALRNSELVALEPCKFKRLSFTLTLSAFFSMNETRLKPRRGGLKIVKGGVIT